MWQKKIYIYNLNQRGGDAIYDVIVTECEKYLSTTILKPATILAEVIKLHGVHFLKMKPKNKHLVLNFTWAQGPYRKLITEKASNTIKLRY